MGKRLLNLYTEDSLIELAKVERINLSRFFTELLSIELKVIKTIKDKTEKEIIEDLKIVNAKLTNELRLKIEELKAGARVKQDEYENELWNKIREKERRIVELEEEADVAAHDICDYRNKCKQLEADRDEVMRENGNLNCHIDDLEIERDRLREALQTIADECEIEFQYAADMANAALKEQT